MMTIVPIGWRNELFLKDNLVESITPIPAHDERMALNDCLLNLFYYGDDKHSLEILNELIDRLNEAHDNFRDYFEAPKNIIVVSEKWE